MIRREDDLGISEEVIKEYPPDVSVISKEIIAEYLPDDPRIVEAGAYNGTDTLKMARFWPNGYVYAFEPVPYLFVQLQQTVADQKNISCYQSALSDTSGTEQMFMSQPPYSASSSLYEPQEYLEEHPEARFEVIEVETTTLDDWAQQQGIERIDFLWFDMQGAELRALQGAVNVLRHVKAIKTEVNLTERYRGMPLYRDVRRWLEAYGFKVAIEALHRGHWGNVLFVREQA